MDIELKECKMKTLLFLYEMFDMAIGWLERGFSPPEPFKDKLQEWKRLKEWFFSLDEGEMLECYILVKVFNYELEEALVKSKDRYRVCWCFRNDKEFIKEEISEHYLLGDVSDYALEFIDYDKVIDKVIPSEFDSVYSNVLGFNIYYRNN